MDSTELALKSTGIAQAFRLVTGIEPDVIYNNDGTSDLVFDAAQGATLREWIETQAAKNSDIRINLSPVMTPYVIKKMLPITIAALTVAAIIGYSLSKSKAHRY